MSAADFPEIDVEEKPLPIRKRRAPLQRIRRLEDSLQNCIAPIPKPVAPTFGHRWTTPGPSYGTRRRLRPGSSTNSDIDAERDFILSVYPANDTIAIYEPPDRKRNIPAHITGGKFLERQTVLKPGLHGEA